MTNLITLSILCQFSGSCYPPSLISSALQVYQARHKNGTLYHEKRFFWWFSDLFLFARIPKLNIDQKFSDTIRVEPYTMFYLLFPSGWRPAWHFELEFFALKAYLHSQYLQV